MKLRTLRPATVLALAAALLLTACGDSDDKNGETASASATETSAEPVTPAETASAEDIAALDAVTVTGDSGAAATASFDAPFIVSADVARVLDEGTGDELVAGNVLGFHIVVYTGSDAAAPVESSWSGDPASGLLDGNELPPMLTDTLVGLKVGARVLYAQPSTEAESYLFIVDAISTSKALTRAEGEAVTPPDGLPTVVLDDAGVPTVTVPDGYAAPTDLVAQTLIKGNGAVVESGQTIRVHYSGWKVSDGSKFEASWDSGNPLTTAIGTSAVIAGWDQGLVGQTVGSQVLLVIPPSLGYGASEGHELQKETLIFVVDILGAS